MPRGIQSSDSCDHRGDHSPEGEGRATVGTDPSAPSGSSGECSSQRPPGSSEEKKSDNPQGVWGTGPPASYLDIEKQVGRPRLAQAWGAWTKTGIPEDSFNIRGLAEAWSLWEVHKSPRDRARASALATSLRVIGEEELAVAIEECGLKMVFYECGEGPHWFATTWRCRLRICPVCARTRARRLLEAYKHLAGVPHLKHLVLSEPNVPHLSSATIDRLRRLFKRLRHRKYFADRWRGGLCSLEITYSKITGWHAHLHVLIEGEYIAQTKIREAWEDICGGQRMVFVQAITGAREAIKYIVKPSDDLVKDPRALRQLLNALQGKRLLTAWGTWYGEGVPTETEPRECPICGASLYWVGNYTNVREIARSPPLQAVLPYG